MITEISRFVNDVPDFVKQRAIEPKTGIHILVRIDDKGHGQVVGHEKYLGKKHGEVSGFLKECAKRQELSWMIDTNKCFDLPAKGIHSASPFSVAFKREHWIGGSKYPAEPNKPNVIDRLDIYFEKCLDPKYNFKAEEQQKIFAFKNFLKNELVNIVNPILETNSVEESDYIIIYNQADMGEYEKFNIKYLAEGLFNTSEYNIEVENEVYGTSNFYNGFNSKKPFLTHQTASFDITRRISGTEAKNLAEFSILIGKRLFPNPLPIFIDDKELILSTLDLFHREEGKRVTYREIIKDVRIKKDANGNSVVGNYYLLYFTGGSIRDFDFVSKFDYYLGKDESEKWTIKNLTELTVNREKDVKELVSDVTLTTVFDFETYVVKELFNNSLVKFDEKKDEMAFKYFEDLDSKYYRPALYTLLLKYRKPIYDFIYKSMRQSIGARQFEDICMTGIMDDLIQNRIFPLKIKLNIFFSLYQYFNQPTNQSYMPSKIIEHKSQLEEILTLEDKHIESDDLYAFGVGQLIFFLLSKSEAGDKTHALLEPFLQKTNQGTFNETVTNTINKYKHAIYFKDSKFNKLAAEVLDFQLNKPLSELKPQILAGYFCPNLLYKSTKNNL